MQPDLSALSREFTAAPILLIFSPDGLAEVVPCPFLRGLARDEFMRKKILIVEDNTELLELMRSNLRQAGYATMAATNGLEALKKARANSPDLILLDLVLPELDGFAVCEHLRKEAPTVGTPIIMLTGLTSEMTRYAGMESGANEYVTKPANIDHLLSRIEHWLHSTSSDIRPQPADENKPLSATTDAD